MRKAVNKKGQQSSFQTIGWILGIFVLIVVALAFTGVFGEFTDIFSKADVDLTLISQKCSALATPTGTAYCTDKTEIGKNSYVNCDYAVTALGASVEGNPPTCDVNEDPKKICTRLSLEDDNFDAGKVKVNGKACSVWNAA